jgi:prepilin peptidase CpaA
MLETATLLFFPALMVFAAFSDLLTMTISNRVPIALTFLFIALAIASGLTTAEISRHLASFDTDRWLRTVRRRLDRRR